MSILFDEIIFGPVHSRRLGISLGINLLPEDTKYCSFNCIYCECGWTLSTVGDRADFHRREDIRDALHHRLKELKSKNVAIDALTFAGNGEPTLHADFAEIINDTLELKDCYYPEARVVVLSNSTTLNNKGVFDALLKVENIMKLDCGTEETFRLLNNPLVPVTLEEVVANLCRFNGKLTVQTLLINGEWKGKMIDNTSGEEIEKWLGHIKLIKPRLVMLYPIDRPAPAADFEKTSPETIEHMATLVRALGIDVKVYH
jgi:wyosine [tRNA(Phe)-imidazoG37] synthetase (radical SAM superfamily)